MCPAIVSAPCRADAPAFFATLNWTCPDPVPLGADVTEIQSALAAAVHVQPVAAVTDTDPVPPFASKACDVGVIVESHDGGGGGPDCAWACVTVIVCPATRAVPVRDAPALADTFSVTAPLPLPFAPTVTSIHGTWLAAVHPQVPPDCTLTATVPPCAGTVVVDALTS